MSRDVVHGHECKTFSRQREKREGCVMSKIPLPPLPHWNEEMYRQQIRARDQEIVRCVLQAAANECRAIELAAWREYKIGRKTSAHTEGRSDGAGECAAVIKALEFHHE
jgi:hypothetical protein